jgi:UDP-2-acetamido-3-amino-2,3-dideoxy-glucuronate N-acetyltransferase
VVDVYIHPTSIVETQHIGRNTYIWAFTHIMEAVSISENCNIGSHCFIESQVCIGNNVTIKNGNMLWEGITLEDGVFIGPGACFTNDLYPRSPRLPQAKERYRDREWLVPTRVKQGVSLGSGAVVLAGVVLGSFAMVGAGAVVTKDVAPYTLVVGNPARVVGWVCQCGQPLKFKDDRANCSFCARSFVKLGNSVHLTVERE